MNPPDKISYRENAPLTAAQLAGVFERSGIRRPTKDLARIGRMIQHADLVFTAWHGERLVGATRVLTDYCYSCYVSDLAVDREYQRQGIGRELLRMIRERLGDEVMLLLLAAPEAAEYYAKVGYEKADNAWRINRTK